MRLLKLLPGLLLLLSAGCAAPIKDPHSYARPEVVRVEHLTLDLNVDFAKKQLTGTATLRLKREQVGATTLTLDTQGLTINRITLLPGGAVAAWKLGAAVPILGQALEVTLAADTSEVAIEYASRPGAKALQWLEPAMTAGKVHPFLLSQSESILARTWVPLQDSPSVRFTYDATLRVPKELLALMSAENPQKKSPDGVYHFHMPQPVPSYLMAIAVGDLDFHAYDGRSGVYAEPATLPAAAHEFEDTPRMIAAAEKLYGPYRWGRYDLLVLPPSFPYGGMENPRLTFVTPTILAGDKSLVDLIAHELAHSWSGNLVTNATWNDFWLNEGFTNYFQQRITEELYGHDRSEMLWLLDLNKAKQEMATLPTADQALYLQLAGRDPDDATENVYWKGSLFVRLLEETAGRERWDRFLREYFDAHAFTPMTTALFVETLKAKLPDVAAKAGIDAWLYGPGFPANCPAPRSTAFTSVEADAKRFATGAPAASIPLSSWSTQERLHFIRSLPKLGQERMAALDATFQFSASGNSEILAAWLFKSIQDGYRPAFAALERFLTVQGRRKFLKQLYTELAKTPDNLAWAWQVYVVARPTYHPVSQSAIDGILKAK